MIALSIVSQATNIPGVIREDLSRNYGFLLMDVSRLMRTVYDRRVKRLGLTRSQWWVLNHLFRTPGATQSELAAILEVERPTLGRLLDRLERKGWVRREDDARDRRAWRVYLTPAAEPAMRKLRRHAKQLRGDALSGLTAKEREKFVDALLAIKSNLTKMSRNGAR
jgi:DNA-binding MarR family transcriptional regulator